MTSRLVCDFVDGAFVEPGGSATFDKLSPVDGTLVRLAEECGAKTLVSGGVPAMGDLDAGAWSEPTLWTGLTNAERPLREEIFGPVAAVGEFDTDYGLASSVWTTDPSRGHRVAQRMYVGMSWVNTWFLRDLRSRFGGVGLSGIGREGGQHSMDLYTEPTNVCVQT